MSFLGLRAVFSLLCALLGPWWGRALLDYNIFNCCLLRDLLAAAAQGYGSVLALLVCVSLSVTLWAVPKSRACTWLWSGKVIVSWLVTIYKLC